MNVETLPHRYEPLSGPNHIRLLCLEPALSADEVLPFSFVCGDLQDHQDRYEAISYTWGEPLLVHPLYHGEDGTHIVVTANLDRALRYFRRPVTQRLLWADAVCINQVDGAEKSHQIPLMAQIYRNAKKVLAWVGGGTEEERGMQHLSTLSRNNRDTVEPRTNVVPDHVSHNHMSPKARASMQQFFKLSWFTRLWIIQEVVFNNDIEIFCYHTLLTWSRLISGLFVLQRDRSEISGSISSKRITALLSIARLWRYQCTVDDPRKPQLAKPENFLDILSSFSSYDCSDARDRIYALYSMTTDIAPTERTYKVGPWPRIHLNIDYSLDVEQTYHMFAMACIRSGRFSEVLNAVLARQSSPDAETWISWVPDWRNLPMALDFSPDVVQCVYNPGPGGPNTAVNGNGMLPNVLPIKLRLHYRPIPGFREPQISHIFPPARSVESVQRLLFDLILDSSALTVVSMLVGLLIFSQTGNSEDDQLSWASIHLECDLYMHVIRYHFHDPPWRPPFFSSTDFSSMSIKLQTAMQDQRCFIAKVRKESNQGTTFNKNSVI
jgi:hypothetical protein